jgi:hypothetical protein
MEYKLFIIIKIINLSKSPDKKLEHRVIRDDVRNNIRGLKPDRFPKPSGLQLLRKLFVAVSLRDDR